ncbi:hypothetical protein VNO77_44679 [Canavalia gladiata]|uniref:Uncharacterized protein n=1 Tax=Canavalia gladiata TaxID=3824 RepID=A0AAN9PQM5_CANGL
MHPIYGDPVQDFGFFRYEPRAIHLLNYEEIPLTLGMLVVSVVSSDSDYSYMHSNGQVLEQARLTSKDAVISEFFASRSLDIFAWSKLVANLCECFKYWTKTTWTSTSKSWDIGLQSDKWRHESYELFISGSCKR